ncbi:MAG: tetratricopeptide repeat protein [bacterium]|nr:tetratricopeptide repeat protein [bacterium]
MKTIKIHTSKKKIKEDELAAFLANAEEWVKQYWRYGVYVVSGIIAIVLIILFISYSKKSAEYDAGYELSKIKQLLNASNYEQSIEELNKFIKKFRGTNTAKEAQLYLGKVYLIQGLPDSAATIFQNFIQHNSKKSLLTIAATNGLATAKESKKMFDEAYNLYMQVYQMSPLGVMAPQALYDAARVALLANHPEKAKNAALKLVYQFPNSSLKAQAEEILQRTGK